MIGEDDASWKSRRKGLTSASELHVSSSCFLVYPPPLPAHTRYLVPSLGNSFVGSFVDTALAACLQHLPPLDFNPICLSTPSNPSGYLLGSLAENFSSDHLHNFNIFILSFRFGSITNDSRRAFFRPLLVSLVMNHDKFITNYSLFFPSYEYFF